MDNEKFQRYPYASTPAVSPNPTNESMLTLQAQKANMRLPVGPLADTSENEDVRGGPKILMGRHMHVTARARYNADSSTVSPIPASKAINPILFTEPRGDQGEAFHDDCNWDFSQHVTSTSSNVFPYPEGPEEDVEDAGENLCSYLTMLNALRELESERQRLNYGGRRKAKPEEKCISYEFQNDTFDCVNSEASLYALHLLFTSFDAIEAEVKFRDCWPVYEKKLEGLFRRASLEWLKEIIENQPSFFPDVRVEALGGLLVNPGGERFLAFMQQFATLVMYTVAKNNQDAVQKRVLLPPIPVEDPEITNRQLHILRTRSHNLAEDSMICYRRILQNELGWSTETGKVDNLFNRVCHIDENLSDEILKLASETPEAFGNPTEEDFMARDDLVLKTKIDDIAEDPFRDPFLQRFQVVLTNDYQEIYTPVSLFQDAMEDFDKIWHIINMDKANPVTINCSEFPPHLLDNGSGTASFNCFLDNCINTIESIVTSKFSNGPVGADIKQNYEVLAMRLNFLEVLETKLGLKELEEKENDVNDEYTSAQLPELKSKLKTPKSPQGLKLKNMRPERDLLKIRLNGYDWSHLSGIQEKNTHKLWDMTPTRIFDVNRSSGCTPGINNFLESTFTSLSESYQTSIVKRRRTHRNKPQKTMKQTLKEVRPESADKLADLVDISAYNGRHGLPKVKSVNLGHTPTTSQAPCRRNSPTTPLDTTTPTYPKRTISFNDSLTPQLSSSLLNSSMVGKSPGDGRALSSNLKSLSSLFRANENTPNTINLSDATAVQEIAPLHTQFSPGSDADISLDLNRSVQERISSLLASTNLLSPLQNLEEEDVVSKERVNANSGVEVNETPTATSELTSRLEDPMKSLNLSMIDDWEGTKGIMETSHIEWTPNSDSDE